MEGIPGQAATLERLLADQQEIIGRLRLNVGGEGETLWQYYDEAIRRYAAFVHLLPASERHHHRGAGGLLRHGLECGLYANEKARDTIIAPEETPRKRKLIEPRWMFGVFAAALCHDIGKPATDIEVVNETGDAWNPMEIGLYDWVQENGIERYFLRWRNNRHKLHEALTGLLIDRILTPSMRTWMAEAGPNILIETLGALNGIEDGHSRMTGIVKEADRASTEMDMGAQTSASMGETGVPVESYLIDAMRGLFKTHKEWEINEKNKRLWYMDDSLFLVWPKAAYELVEYLRKNNTRGIPTDPDTLADILIERNIAVAPAADGRYWAIVPDLLQTQDRTVRLITLRLNGYKYLVTHEPPVELGVVIAESEWTKDITQNAAKLIKPQDDNSPVVQSTVTSGNAQASDDGSPDSGETQAVRQESPAETPPGTQPVNDEQDLEGGTNDSSPATPDKPSPEDARRWLEQHGLAGTMLVHFAEDVAGGHKTWEEDLTWIVPQKQLAIRYPRAIQGYGVEPPAFTNACAEANWLEQDRRNPMKRVFDTPIGDGTHRCILLDGQVCEMLDVLMKQAPKTNTREAKKQPARHSKQAGMTAAAPASNKKAPPNKTHAQSKRPAQDNPWPMLLKQLKAQADGAPELVKINGQTLVPEQETMAWYSRRLGITKSKLRIQLMRYPEKTRFVRVNNKGYIHVE